MINAYTVMIIKLCSCVNLESKILEELNTCLATLSDIMALIGDKIQNILLDTIINNSDEDSSIVIEEHLCLL